MEHAVGASGAPAVLVIDDEVDLLDLFAKRLTRAGFDVSTASTGAEAIALLETREFRVVICDIHMPGGVTGFDVLSHVRAVGRAPAGFLFVTGHGEGTPEMEQAQALGVDGVYAKPIASKVLIAHLRQLCGLPELPPPPAAT